MIARRTMALAAILSGVVSLAAALALVASILFGPQPGEAMVLAGILLCGGASMAMMVFVALYVYLDAEARGMKGVLWALLIVLFAGFPGLVVYLLMRPPLRAS